MNAQDQIDKYIADQPSSKREDIRDLHVRILRIAPECKLWFLDGRNSENKVVSNPSIGYGSKAIEYAGGDIREFYKIGLSANTTGVSVYFIGMKEKKYLSETYGKKLGRAQITGYCVKFRHLEDVNIDTLEEMVGSHMTSGSASRLVVA